MIKINNLSLQVSDKTLLKNFSAEIQSNECLGIFGPNGAGKSTFLKSLMGIFPGATGEIILDGHAIHKKCSWIAYLPQEFEPLPVDYSVLGFLKLLVRGYQWGFSFPLAKDTQRCEEVLAETDALHLAKKSMNTLSGGERKRVMLAALLLEQPKILLLDEPLANLDPRYQYELLQLIEKLQKKLQLTLLITAHDFNPLLHLMNRVMFIGQGNAVLNFPDKVIQSEVLSNLYHTKLQVVELGGRKWVLSNEQQIFLNHGDHCHGEHCFGEK